MPGRSFDDHAHESSRITRQPIGPRARRGRSLLPLLRGEAPQWDEEVYAEYDLDHGGTRAELRGWRTREWKLVLDLRNPGRDELYHLAEDPDERANRIDDPGPAARQARERLQARIRARMEAIAAPEP